MHQDESKISLSEKKRNCTSGKQSKCSHLRFECEKKKMKSDFTVPLESFFLANFESEQQADWNN